eukprot:7709672-Alexandrium_andersonii.AAC.1
MVELGRCGATWWDWILALERYADMYQSSMITDPDTNARVFGSNVVVVIDDALNSFVNDKWQVTLSDGKYVTLTREYVLKDAPTHVGGVPLPKNNDE